QFTSLLLCQFQQKGREAVSEPVMHDDDDYERDECQEYERPNTSWGQLRLRFHVPVFACNRLESPNHGNQTKKSDQDDKDHHRQCSPSAYSPKLRGESNQIGKKEGQQSELDEQRD